MSAPAVPIGRLVGRAAARLDAAEPAMWAVLRIGYGLTIATHGLPKLMGHAHGSMADPMAASIRLIGGAMHLPFAPAIAMLVALLEGVGGPLLALGFATRFVGVGLALEMAGICVALGPTYPWIDRGIEYPVVLGLVALALACRGGGRWSIDRAIACNFTNTD